MSEIEGVFKIVGYVSAPLLALFGWLGKRMHGRMDKLEEKYSELDKRTAVQSIKIDAIQRDICKIDNKLDQLLNKLK